MSPPPSIAAMASCFHCGLPLEGEARRVAILGAERELCCAGCEAVARTIVGAGLERYYETRTSPGSPPPALPQVPDYGAAAGGEASLVLSGVRCSACLWLIERTLRAAAGVARADVNYATHRAHVAWDPALTSPGALIAALRAVGYDACPYQPAAQAAAERGERRAALWRLFVAGFGAMQIMMYAFPAYVDDGALTPEAAGLMRWASLLLTAPVLFFACTPFFSGARAELRRGRVGLDTPIALGLAGAFAASAWATVSGEGEVYFDSVAMLAFLLLGARFIEDGARRRAARALDPLLRWAPAKPVAVGDELAVAPGERVPADGVVVRGASSADESLLTGEARAVRKREGDGLIAGSVNLEQPLVMRATRVGGDTRAAAIARLVERGLAAKPRVVQHAERIAGGLTAAILALALGAFFLPAGGFWSAIAVLVVACPCALALAAPAVLTRASGALLRRGVLLANAAALQPLERATDVVLDKTGTLTSGRLAVSGLELLSELDRETCLAWAAHLEAGSRHPIARAFPGGDAGRVEDARHVLGMGIEGRVEGRLLRIGSAAFCRVEGVPGEVFLADENGALAAFRLADELRPDAAGALAELRRHCVVHLASGDTPEAVERMARRLGIEHAHGAMTPEAKLAYVAALQAQGRVVAMVGDGLNDAPVLARADVSLAMGSGADAAQLRADLVLQKDSLADVLAARHVASRAMRLVRENLGWALAYNAVALPLAAAGWIGPLEAALAMGASSASVLLNALRPLEPKEEPWKASTSSSPSPSPSYS